MAPTDVFPGTFWPKPSLLGCLRSLEKKLGQNSFYNFFPAFFKFCGILWGSGPTTGSRAQPAPKMAQIPQGRPMNVVWSQLWLEEELRAGRPPPFPCIMGVPGRFRRVKEPNGTIWTTCGLPPGPARPARVGPENVFGRGSRGSEKNFSPKIFLVQKHYSLGPGWFSGPKN